MAQRIQQFFEKMDAHKLLRCIKRHEELLSVERQPMSSTELSLSIARAIYNQKRNQNQNATTAQNRKTA